MKQSKKLWDDNDWNFDRLNEVTTIIEKIAVEKFGLDCYPNQLEVISSEQMMDAYTSHGMPVFYFHWSFGKNFTQTENNYRRGRMGLAYEIVINSSPCISYLMEENTMVMQTLVIAHAAFGHNSFFKGNYLFKEWTDAEAIIDYLIFAKKYITKCEEKYGLEAVEKVLDSCHALQFFGVDRYHKPKRQSKEKELERLHEREEYRQRSVDDLWKTLPQSKNKDPNGKVYKPFLEEKQENILYFLEKNAPLLKNWQREIIRIVRKTSQYFYPQMQTKVMNEGWASFWHYTLMNELWEQGFLDDGHMLEFMHSHTSVLFQPDFDDQRYSGLNPYYLGFSIFMDIKRMCDNPTDEDKKWFPDITGGDWLTEIKYAMENFKDSSFVLQYLSPKVIRDLKLFVLKDEEDENYLVTNIQDQDGYIKIRKNLSQQYEINRSIPDIQITDFAIDGDRTLFLEHTMIDKIPLDNDSAQETIRHLRRLWGFDIMLESIDEVGDVRDIFESILSSDDENIWEFNDIPF